MTATDQDILDRLRRGEARFEHIELQQKAMLEILERVSADAAVTKEIVEAWSAAKTAGKFIRWIGPTLAGLLAIGAMVKTGIATALGLWK